MKSRMHNWSAFFTVVGWIVIVFGLLAALPTMFVSLVGVALGMGLLFTSACLDWMDGVLEHLSAINETQKATMEYTKALAKGAKIDREECREHESAEKPDLRTSNAEEEAEMQAANEAAEAAHRRREEKYDMDAAMRAARNLRK